MTKLSNQVQARDRRSENAGSEQRPGETDNLLSNPFVVANQTNLLCIRESKQADRAVIDDADEDRD